MKINNILRRNKTVVIRGCEVAFDAHGIADVSDEIGNAMLKLGYRTDKPPAKTENPDTKQQPDLLKQTEDVPLDTLSTAQLKKLAKERGIDIGDATKKAEIIEIMSAQAGR